VRFNEIRRESVATQVYDLIRERILDGEMLPGERLREAGIARDLGVSRSPVREAFRLLEADGLIDLYYGRGAFVKELTLEEMREVCTARKVLGSFCTGRAAERATPADVARLRQAVTEIEALVSAGDYREAVSADLRLHRLIWKASGHPLLCEILGRLGVQCCFFIVMQHAEEAYARRGGLIDEEHHRIIDAIAASDAGAAQALAAEHAVATADVVLGFVESGVGRLKRDQGATQP
jgi:DNA-binding GntR family transcriptional regulator